MSAAGRIGALVAATLAVLVPPGAADAQTIQMTGPLSSRMPSEDLDKRALGTVEMAAGYVRAVAPRNAVLSDVGEAGLSARAFYGETVAVAAGLEFAVGAASSPKAGGAFAGAATLFPVGVALLPTNADVLAALAGVGFDGASAGEPGALVMPLELRLAFDLGPRVRVTADARPAWTPAEPRRRQGAPDFRWVDEVSARLALRWGRKWEDDRVRARGVGQTSAGYFLRAEIAERMHATYIGGAIGFELVGGAMFKNLPRW